MNIDGGVSGMLVGTDMGTQWDWSTHQVIGKPAAEFAIFFGVFVGQKNAKIQGHLMSSTLRKTLFEGAGKVLLSATARQKRFQALKLWAVKRSQRPGR